MKTVLLLITAAAAFGQNRGEQLFATTCGSGYCHGGGGAGGGAPRLAARGFTQAFITATVTDGVPGTTMAAFGSTLPRADLNAIVGYVAKLNGIVATSSGPVAGTPKLTAEAARGKVLFSEAARGFGRCSTCHEVEGRGLAVAAPIQKVPASVAALKSVATPRVVTAKVGTESMPALIVAKKTASVTFYDLTVSPPVMRTEAPALVQTTEGSAWRHTASGYSDAELGAILAYLRVAPR